MGYVVLATIIGLLVGGVFGWFAHIVHTLRLREILRASRHMESGPFPAPVRPTSQTAPTTPPGFQRANLQAVQVFTAAGEPVSEPVHLLAHSAGDTLHWPDGKGGVTEVSHFATDEHGTRLYKPMVAD